MLEQSVSKFICPLLNHAHTNLSCSGLNGDRKDARGCCCFFFATVLWFNFSIWRTNDRIT